MRANERPRKKLHGKGTNTLGENIQGKGAQSDLPETVEGAETEESIVEKFKEVYEALYNSAESNTDSLKEKIKDLIKEDSMNEVNKITGDSVKEVKEEV